MQRDLTGIVSLSLELKLTNLSLSLFNQMSTRLQMYLDLSGLSTQTVLRLRKVWQLPKAIFQLFQRNFSKRRQKSKRSQTIETNLPALNPQKYEQLQVQRHYIST